MEEQVYGKRDEHGRAPLPAASDGGEEVEEVAGCLGCLLVRVHNGGGDDDDDDGPLPSSRLSLLLFPRDAESKSQQKNYPTKVGWQMARGPRGEKDSKKNAGAWSRPSQRPPVLAN